MSKHRKTRTKEVARRPIRTTIQIYIAYEIIGIVDSFYELTGKQEATLVGPVAVLVTLVMVAIENRFGEGLLRDVDDQRTPTGPASGNPGVGGEAGRYED